MFGNVPEEVDLIDFALFASIRSFTQIYIESATHAELVELEEKLTKFQIETPFEK